MLDSIAHWINVFVTLAVWSAEFLGIVLLLFVLFKVARVITWIIEAVRLRRGPHEEPYGPLARLLALRRRRAGYGDALRRADAHPALRSNRD